MSPSSIWLCTSFWCHLDSLVRSDHISSESCLSYFISIRELRRFRNALDSTRPTAQSIATSLNHCKVDYCNSLVLDLHHATAANLIVVSWFSTLFLLRCVSNTPRLLKFHLFSNPYICSGSRLINVFTTQRRIYKTHHPHKLSYLHSSANLWGILTPTTHGLLSTQNNRQG